jgi:hypothetical protein
VSVDDPSDEALRVDRDTIARQLQSNEDADVCRALIATALHHAEWRWVQSQCLALAAHSSSKVRGVVPICFGHLARIHRQIDRDPVEAVLDRQAVDPIPEVRSAVQDARDDFATYLDRPADRRL